MAARRRRRLAYCAAATALTCLTLGSSALAATAGEGVGGGSTQGSIRNTGGPNAVAGRYIVALKDSAVSGKETAVKAKATSMVRSYGGRVGLTYHATIRGFSASMSEAQAKRMAADPNVWYVEQVHRYQVAGTQQNPPNWGDDRIDQQNLPLNNSFSYPDSAGEGVTVYVLDTGANFNHSDYEGRVTSGRDTIDNDDNASDCHGHGSHTMGTVLSKTYGVAKKAKGVAVRVLNCSGSGTSEQIAAGIDWVTANARKPAVASMSLGGQGADSTMENAVQRGINAGVQYVLAAGNNNGDACNFSPARLPAAVTVGATKRDDSRPTDWSNGQGSNYGTCLDIFAPGDSIISTSMSGGTTTMSGTSMATPHVSGVAALYLACNPGATASEVRNALVNNGVTGKVTNPGNGSPNVLLQMGFLDTSCGGTPSDNDYSVVANPASGTVEAGAAAQTTIETKVTKGNAQSITLTASGLPAGTTASFEPASLQAGANSKLTLTTTTSTPAGQHSVTINADGAEADHSATYTLTVNGGDPGGRTYRSTTAFPIRDLSTVRSPISVPLTGQAATTVKVEASIRHTCTEDLGITLIAPNGNRYTLLRPTYGTCTPWNGARSFQVPNVNAPAGGSWSLSVTDYYYNDVGTLDGWSITL